MNPKLSSKSYRLSSVVYGLLLFSFVFFLFSRDAQAASKCAVGQCWSTKNNATGCPAGWQTVPGSCTTPYGAGKCCSEGSACPVGQCFSDENGIACPDGWSGYAGSCNTTSNPPKPGHCCQEGTEVSGGSGGGAGAAAWNKANGGSAVSAKDICFHCVNKSVFDQQCTKLGGKLDAANSPACLPNEVCCNDPNQGNASATAPPPGGMTNLGCEATGDCQISDLVAKAVMFAQFLMGLAGALFLFAFVYGGAMYIMAFGRPAWTQKGQKALVQSALGMVLIMAAWTIVTYLVSSLGANIGGSSVSTSQPASAASSQQTNNPAALVGKGNCHCSGTVSAGAGLLNAIFDSYCPDVKQNCSSCGGGKASCSGVVDLSQADCLSKDYAKLAAKYGIPSSALSMVNFNVSCDYY